MIDFQVARDKLLSFETADEIAQFLESQGVKAARAMSTSCAIAEWMTETTGTQVYVNQQEMWRMFDTAPVHHNRALGEFIHRFDEGYYPELISNPDDAKICRQGIASGMHPPCWMPTYVDAKYEIGDYFG